MERALTLERNVEFTSFNGESVRRKHRAPAYGGNVRAYLRRIRAILMAAAIFTAALVCRAVSSGRVLGTALLLLTLGMTVFSEDRDITAFIMILPFALLLMRKDVRTVMKGD